MMVRGEIYYCPPQKKAWLANNTLITHRTSAIKYSLCTIRTGEWVPCWYCGSSLAKLTIPGSELQPLTPYMRMLTASLSSSQTKPKSGGKNHLLLIFTQPLITQLLSTLNVLVIFNQVALWMLTYRKYRLTTRGTWTVPLAWVVLRDNSWALFVLTGGTQIIPLL